MNLLMSTVFNLILSGKSRRMASQFNLSCTGERGVQIALLKSNGNTKNWKSAKLLQEKIHRFAFWSLEGGVYRI